MVPNTYMRMRPVIPVQKQGSLFIRYGIGILMMLVSLYSADVMLFLFGAVVFTMFYIWFFNIQVPPIILFLFFFQWFFNQGQLVHALLTGKPISELFFPGHSIDTVFFLGMIGTAAFFLGMVYFSRKIPVQPFSEIRRVAFQFDVTSLLGVFLATYPLLAIALSTVWLFPGLTQPLYMLLYFKWSIFFLLFICVFMQNRYKVVLLCIILFEFIVGFASFWATFKDVVYVSFLAYWIFYFRENLFLRWILPVVVVIMIYIGSLWSIVKQDYRHFLKDKATTQGAVATRGEALDKFSDLVLNASDADLERGFDALILRMSWIGAFNKVYNHVPSKVPHQDGDLWISGVVRPFTPRILFPGKTRLSDSQELNQYSGLNVDETNTSISLSTIAGSYVDYGPVGMHVPLLLFGLFFGWLYKKIFDLSANFLVGHALSIPLIFIVNVNEQSINRLVSSLVLYFLVVWFVCKVIQKPFLRFVMWKPKR
jgi:hypothetical protein